VARLEINANEYSFVGETEGKRSLRRPTSRWEHNIVMDFKEVG
jgi:hypothetical protein